REGPNPQRWLQQIAKLSERHVSSLSFSADDNLLAWSTGRIHIWDASNSQPYPFPPVLPKTVLRNVAFCRDRNQLAVIGLNGGPEVWDVATRQRVYPSRSDDFRGARDRALDGILALSADSAWLAASGARGSITVWDLSARKLLLT